MDPTWKWRAISMPVNPLSNKRAKAEYLMSWLDKQRKKGVANLAAARHHQEVRSSVERGDEVPQKVLQRYAEQKFPWAVKEWESKQTLAKEKILDMKEDTF